MIAPVCLWLFLPLAALAAESAAFPSELVDFVPYEHNPVFEGRGPGHWDELIRERGWILREDDTYHLWYTGYTRSEGLMKLGYATSRDGITWERYAGNPIYTGHWVEDMTVLKHDGTYYMFAEGLNDEAHLLTSTDRIHWTRQGRLDVRKVNGDPISPGAYGTPAVFQEDGTWFLFYEREDEAIWLATSSDLNLWTNVQDDPVIRRGPGAYDQAMLALDQIVKHGGRYYAFYHGLIPDSSPQEWTTAVALSDDLIHWEKYQGNPILANDKSSPVLVDDGKRFRLYTMHPAINLYFPRKAAK
jgi:predicted GH43/DUF377 family glycosyl hydrolase